MAHTPGPWVFESKRDEGDNIFTQSKPQMRIANVFGNCSVEPYQDNANLITAAPDLLRLLRTLYDLTDGCVERYEEEYQAAMGESHKLLTRLGG